MNKKSKSKPVSAVKSTHGKLGGKPPKVDRNGQKIKPPTQQQSTTKPHTMPSQTAQFSATRLASLLSGDQKNGKKLIEKIMFN